jgi:type VI secretion system protein ImpH
MASDRRRSRAPLGDELYRESHRFEFFQAVALLERFKQARSSVGEGHAPEDEGVRFDSRISLAFPASDVHAIEAQPAGKPDRMAVNVIGLAGALGPLPNPVSETVLQRLSKRDTAFASFLNIFNHRLASLLYRVRLKHRVGLGFRSPDQRPFARYLFSLIGLGAAPVQNRMGVQDRALLRYAGMTAGLGRSIHAVGRILSDYFNVTVVIRPFVGRWLPLEEDQQTAIGRRGRNQELGRSVVLGSKVWDQESQFELTIGPLTLPEYIGFLPIGQRHQPLVALTRFYVGQCLDFNGRLLLKPEQVPPLQLGSSHIMLGWTSWLATSGPRQAPGEISLRLGTMLVD